MTKTLKWLGGGLAAAMLLGLAGLFSAELTDAQTPPSGPPHRFAGTVSVDGEGAVAGTSVTASVNGTECGSVTVVSNVTHGSTYAVNVPATCAEAGDTVSFQVGGYDAAETGTWAGGGRSDINLTASTGMADMPEDPDMDECPADDDMADDGPAEPGADDGPAEPGAADDMADDCPSDMVDDDMVDDDMVDDDMVDDDMVDDDMVDDDMVDDDMVDDDMVDDDMVDDDMVDTTTPDVADTGTGLATSIGANASLAAILGLTALAVLLGGYTVARRRI